MASELPTGNGNGNGHGNVTTTDPNFDGTIFNAVAATRTADNIIVSPLLLEALLTLLYLGSDGATAVELERALLLKRFAGNAKMANYYAAHLAQLAAPAAPQETGMQLCSQLVLSEPFAVADEFQKIAQKYFHTVAAVLKRDAANEADVAQLQAHLDACLAQTAPGNGWHIGAELLRSAEQAASAATGVLLVAVNFKSKWFLPFSAYRTGIYDFQLPAATATATANGDVIASTATPAVPVPMLYDDDMFVKYGEFRELDARAIELPYELGGDDDDELAMLLVLPNQRDGLAALEQQLGALDLGALMERMQMESVQVLLPKFRIDFECCLRPYLEQLGIATIFTKEANFKNLLHEKCPEPLQIADVLHKVCIEVNESGSEPSNVTAHKPIVISNSIDTRHKFFRADHPFYFAIRSRDVTYFAGHVAKF